jgi:hypothetical protein
MTTYWFKPKRYGYGSTPTTWQGWAVTLGTVVVMVAMSVYLRSALKDGEGIAAMFGFNAVCLAVLWIVTRRKTEGGFRWRWGGE